MGDLATTLGLAFGGVGTFATAASLVIPRWLEKRDRPQREQREILITDARELRADLTELGPEVRHISRLYETDDRSARRAELYPKVRSRLDQVHDPLLGFIRGHLDVIQELLKLDEQTDLAGSRAGTGWMTTAYFVFEDTAKACSAIVADAPIRPARIARADFLRLANERASLPDPLGAVAERYELTLRTAPADLVRETNRRFLRNYGLGFATGACFVLTIFSFADLIG